LWIRRLGPILGHAFLHSTRPLTHGISIHSLPWIARMASSLLRTMVMKSGLSLRTRRCLRGTRIRRFTRRYPSHNRRGVGSALVSWKKSMTSCVGNSFRTAIEAAVSVFSISTQPQARRGLSLYRELPFLALSSTTGSVLSRLAATIGLRLRYHPPRLRGTRTRRGTPSSPSMKA